ncbi:MAG: tRNA (adenosine(37)-N6)-threonylcarbamoyltransferase complex ATPase subunit type 1 TsaE [Halobacteriovoraceae bacterium]|nr:tRNA (adenosine(37)-N6)-threonylcarbamoyltransferase complex ATPase subunit type 1 TsaE [Halobacteriovoraceae bacterium]
MSIIRTWKKVDREDILLVAKEVGEHVDTPCVLFLEGDVGAGKTTFTKIFVAGKDVEVTSPTYSVINDYNEILHADFYRLESPEDIIHLELPLYLENKKYFIVEWGKKFVNHLSRELDFEFKFYQLSIEIQDNNTRNYTLEKLD